MRLSTEEVQALTEAVPEEYRARVRSVEDNLVNPAGEFDVFVGQKADKPVVIDAKTKRLMKGSGRYPKANDPAEVGKVTAFKLTKTYREALEMAVSLGPDGKRTFEQVLDDFFRACEGSPQTVDCPHPEMHGHKSGGPVKHIVAFKADPNAMFKMIELLAGKARETHEVSGQLEHLHRLLDERHPVQLIGRGQAPGEAAERKRQLIEQGVIEEGWFREIPAEEDIASADG
jgi:hypothetical protein